MFQQSATQDDVQSSSLAATESAAAPLNKVPLAPAEKDPFIDHYFKRIDPRLAATFSPEQCEAIKTMFGARGIAKHAVEVRRSVPVGRGRFYLVLLIGRERRTIGRLYSEGAVSGSANLVGYAVTAALWMVPAIAAALVLQAIL